MMYKDQEWNPAAVMGADALTYLFGHMTQSQAEFTNTGMH